MAPTKRPARHQKTKKRVTKRARLDADAPSKKESAERPPRTPRAIRTRSSGPATVDVYSPNLSTSEFGDLTEDQEDPPKKLRLSLLDDSADNNDETKDARPPKSASAVDGKSMRQIRTARRVAERAHQVNLTEDEDIRIVCVDMVNPGPPRSVSINGKTPREVRASRRLAEKAHQVDLTDEEEERAVNATVNSQDAPKNTGMDSNADVEGKDAEGPRAKGDVGSQSPFKKNGSSLDLFGDDEYEPVEDDDAKTQQDIPDGVESDSNADAEGEPDVEEPVASVKVKSQALSDNVSPESSASVESDAVKKPVQLEDIDFTTGAAARYIEFMKRRGHATSELFISRPASSEHLFSDSSSSSSSSSAFDDSEPDYVEKFDAPSVNDGNSNNDNEKNNSISELNDSYLVYRRDKTIDSLLSNHLRTIARVLNFIARARASGIEVGDFESLAAVKPEKWAELVDAPEHAADFVVKSLLGLSIWDICLLSERAAVLQGEMEELGVVI